jgi:uncharacterized protein YacL
MADNQNEIKELLKQVLAELEAINEQKKAGEEQERKNRRLEINDAEFVFLLFGVIIGFLAQVLYDWYGSLFKYPFWKPLVGVGIVFVMLGFIYVYSRNHNKKYVTKNCAKT